MKNKIAIWMVLSFAASGVALATEGHDHQQEEQKGQPHQVHGDHGGHDDHDNHDGHGDHRKDENHEGQGSHDEQSEKGHDDHDSHDDHSKDESHEGHGSHDEQSEKGHDDHDGHGGHDDHGEESVAELSRVQRDMAGIETLVVTTQSLGQGITAPGEAKLNAYKTTKITPRTPAQVVERHVRLGDHVQKNQPLVTLSSIEMAEAQGALIEANSELRRVKKLGKKVVSGKRFVNAEIAYQLAYAKVNAFGMTPRQIKQFLRKGKAINATGEFQLLSFQEGTVMSDGFVVGELIEPGQVLMSISDESVLWIEARLTPEDATHISVGSSARVQVGEQWMQGKVVQMRHALDETTRTLSVNIEIANEKDHVHPGQFVHVVIESQITQNGIVLPVEAVVRSPDGHWQVFVETAPNRFEPKEIEVVQTVGDQMLVKGLEEGETVVGKGAFFVQSEIAKGGFDPHNH